VEKASYFCTKCEDSCWLVQCRCGCDEVILKRDKFGKLREFVSCHAIRVRDQKGQNNANWKGGDSYNKKTGYYSSIAPGDHPRRTENGRVLKHRLIYESYLSIIYDETYYLSPEQDVHHIDGNKINNALINLELLWDGEHTAGHNSSVLSGRYCYECKSTETYMRKLPSGRLKSEWRKHPMIPGRFLCRNCYNTFRDKDCIVCSQCKELQIRYVKDLCSKCYDKNRKRNRR
jgi:hypothetical protein